MQYRHDVDDGTWRGPVSKIRLAPNSGKKVGRRRIVRLPPQQDIPFTLKSSAFTSLRKRRIRNYNVLRILARARRTLRRFHDNAVGIRRTAIGRVQRLPKHYHGAVTGAGIVGGVGTGMYYWDKRT